MEYTIAIIIAYAYLAFSFQTIAKKTGTDNAMNAWIPVLNLILVAKIAQKPNWMGIMLLVPIVNFAFAIYLLIEIIKITQKPAWLGILLIIPGLGFIVPGFIAFSSGTAPVSKNIGNLIIGMIVSSFLISLIVYYVFTLMPIQNTIKTNKSYSNDKIEDLRKQAYATPKTSDIDSLKSFHENIRKMRVKILDILNQHDKANEVAFPQLQFSEITAFKSKMNVLASALKMYYTDDIMHKPEGSEDAYGMNTIKFNDDPFSQFKEDLDSEENCRLALKKCLITIELLNALKDSIDQLKEMANAEDASPEIARYKKVKPICGIIKLDFPNLKADSVVKVREEKSLVGKDGSGFYTTLPFEFEVALDPELYTLFYRNLAIPAKLDIKQNNLNVTKTDEDTEEDILQRELNLFLELFKSDTANELATPSERAVSQRYGMRFDFLSVETNLTEMDDNYEKNLLRDEDTRKKYIELFPKMIGNDPSKPLPPKGEDPKDHKGRWAKCFEVQQTLSRALIDSMPYKPAYYRSTFTGAAVDFTLKELIDNVKYEEMVKAGTLQASESEDTED